MNRLAYERLKEDVASHLSLQTENNIFIPFGWLILLAYESSCLKTVSSQFKCVIIQIEVIPSIVPQVSINQRKIRIRTTVN